VFVASSHISLNKISIMNESDNTLILCPYKKPTKTNADHYTTWVHMSRSKVIVSQARSLHKV